MFLHGLFKTGKISSQILRQGSEAYLNTTPESNYTLRKWAKTGCWGKHPTNTHRDVVRVMSKQSRMPMVYQAKAQFWGSLTNQPCEDWMYFMLPHEVLDRQVDVPSEWLGLDSCYSGLQANLGQWCAELRQDPQQTAVLGIWGDTAPYNNRDCLLLVLFNCISGNHHRRFWVCGMSKKTLCQCGCSGRCTSDKIWEVVAWSLGALLSGKNPTHRHDGVMFKDISETCIRGTTHKHTPTSSFKQFTTTASRTCFRLGLRNCILHTILITPI